MTEGEEFIREFLYDRGITFEAHKVIEDLKGDSKSHREADFHLTKFDIYIEFFGQWNQGEEHKQRYRKKKQVYHNNNIPCIYIYSENLGIMDYLFNARVLKELKRTNRKKGLLRFRWYLFKGDRALKNGLIIWAILFFVSTYWLFGLFDTYFDVLMLFVIFLFVIATILMIIIIIGLYRQYFKNIDDTSR